MANWVLGTELAPAEQEAAKRLFVHRYTGNHMPAWATRPRSDGQPYPVQFKDDADWLAHTRFAVTTAGKLDHRASYCESNPTWPNGNPVALVDGKLTRLH